MNKVLSATLLLAAAVLFSPSAFCQTIILKAVNGKNGKPLPKQRLLEMGPCSYNCPLNYFDEVPDPGGDATAWRDMVRERTKAKAIAAAERKTLKAGKVVLLPANYTHRRFTLRRKSGKNWVGETPEGGTFTLGPRVLTQATFAAEMPAS